MPLNGRSLFSGGLPLAAVLVPLGAATFAAADAHAQPVTYEGAVDGEKIVLEFTNEPFGTASRIEGRFSYLRDGFDIPLLFVQRTGARLVLSEEKACDDAECAGPRSPAETTWSFTAGGQGPTITGTRRHHGSVENVELRLVGDRQRGEDEEATALGLAGSSERLALSEQLASPEGPIRAETRPYEFAKLNVPLHIQKTAEFSGSAVSYVVDPRTKFIAPRVERLADGSSPATVNELLKQDHWRKNLAAFGCQALRYKTFRGEDGGWTSDAGSLGGYDDTTVEVTFLSSHVMSYIESGSLWCGGASPTNFIEPANIDVRSGEKIAPAELFSGWTDAGPDENLAALVRSKAKEDKGMEEDCGVEILGSYLTAYLVPRDDGRAAVRFGIYNLPTVIAACSRDLATFSVGEIQQHLTPRGRRLLME